MEMPIIVGAPRSGTALRGDDQRKTFFARFEERPAADLVAHGEDHGPVRAHLRHHRAPARRRDRHCDQAVLK
jgi:hypothetical protein